MGLIEALELLLSPPREWSEPKACLMRPVSPPVGVFSTGVIGDGQSTMRTPGGPWSPKPFFSMLVLIGLIAAEIWRELAPPGVDPLAIEPIEGEKSEKEPLKDPEPEVVPECDGARVALVAIPADLLSVRPNRL